jgi:PAS domain S-box-containing protein
VLELARHVTGSFVRFHSTLPPREDLEEGTWDAYLGSESAQRQMFIRLLRSESQLQAMTECWPGVIFSQRADFSFRFASPKLEALTGVSIIDWQTKPQLFWHVVHEADAEELRHQLRLAKETRQPITLTYRIRNANSGRVAYVMEHRQLSISRGGLLLGYEGVWLDVTRQTIAERRLSSAAWKETLSVLTMGLAHDFGNVMAGIHALSESFLEQSDTNRDMQEGLTLIKRNAHQAIQLVHRIINLHQGKTGESNYHNLNEIASDLAELVRKIVPRRVEFSLELCPEALPVYVDVEELRQVVINLVLNAIDAMPISCPARLLVRTAHHTALPNLPNLQGVAPRTPAASLSVQDSGTGIKARHQTSIFDPFFTTKHSNKGSGLGLYNARLFVERHRGGISVDTQEGVGTTFHLWLPQTDFSEIEHGKSCRSNASGRDF